MNKLLRLLALAPLLTGNAIAQTRQETTTDPTTLVALPTSFTSTTKPFTTRPSTTKPALLDLSSPAATARAMRQAIRGGDETALREILAPFAIDGSDAQAVRDPRVQLSDAQAGMIFAGKRIAEVMATRFGETGDRLAGGAGALSSSILDSALADITDAQFHHVSPDLVTLPLPGDPQGRIAFHRVGPSSNPRDNWHVDLSSQPSAPATTLPQTTTLPTTSALAAAWVDGSPQDLLARAAFMRRLAIGLNDAADEIEQGRRRTLDDARATIVDKFHSTIAHSIHPPTAPSTMPAR